MIAEAGLCWFGPLRPVLQVGRYFLVLDQVPRGRENPLKAYKRAAVRFWRMAAQMAVAKGGGCSAHLFWWEPPGRIDRARSRPRDSLVDASTGLSRRVTSDSGMRIPGSQPYLYHMADQRECSCPDRQRSRNVCKHMRAVRFWMAAVQTGAVTPKSRPITPAVIDDAGIGEDLVTLTPEGAAALIEQGASAAPTSYERLYPTCRFEGCQNDPEPRELDCYRHMLVEAF